MVELASGFVVTESGYRGWSEGRMRNSLAANGMRLCEVNLHTSILLDIESLGRTMSMSCIFRIHLSNWSSHLRQTLLPPIGITTLDGACDSQHNEHIVLPSSGIRAWVGT